MGRMYGKSKDPRKLKAEVVGQVAKLEGGFCPVHCIDLVLLYRQNSHPIRFLLPEF
jgi:hypothetical protein